LLSGNVLVVLFVVGRADGTPLIGIETDEVEQIKTQTT